MNTDPLLACQQMFCVCYKHLHLQYKLYLCGIHFAYFRTGVQRPLIRCSDYYVVESVKCKHVQESD